MNVCVNTPGLYRPWLTGIPSRVVIEKPVGAPEMLVPTTPGMALTRSVTSRPPNGRSRNLYSGSTTPTDADVVAMSVSAATLTSTVCACPPTCSVKFNRTCCEIPSVTSL